MGYRNVSGLILRRRDVFEEDQEVSILTSQGVLDVRAPHARKSQKTYCGRLEPPNDVSARLYRSKNHSGWVVSSVDVEDIYADLLREDSIRPRLWPLLSLYRELFPEGEPPDRTLPHLKKGLQYLKDGFRPVGMVTNRALTTLARKTGVAPEDDYCAKCERTVEQSVSDGLSHGISPVFGLLCGRCSSEFDEDPVWTLSAEATDLYRELLERSWSTVRSRSVAPRTLDALEEVIYRLFHYHFEISLDTLRVRKSL